MKCSRKRIHIIISAAAAAVLIAAGCYGAVSWYSEIQTSFSTGAIDIEFENRIPEGAGKNDDGDVAVDFNGDAAYAPRIINKAESCYVRVKLTADTGLQQIDISGDLNGVDDGWRLIGEYLYCTSPLKTGESRYICSGFDVPGSWDYRASNHLEIKASADAVQAQNFTPDFSSAEPWGNIEILESCVGDGWRIRSAAVTAGDGNVKTAGGAGEAGITVSPQDLFKNVSFLPGDRYTDCLKIRNDTDSEAEIMFRAEFEKSGLLEMVRLEIKSGDMLYSGSAADDELRKYRKLFKLNPGEEREVEVSMSLDEKTDNRYQLTADSFTWYFAVVQDSEGSVETGDNSGYAAALLCFCGAVGGVWFTVRKKNENI